MTTVVCCARPLGYGPASKLHLVAEQLRMRGARTVFLGTGLAREFAVHGEIDVVDAEADATRARSVIAAADALLSLMDRDYLRVAQELSKPTFVVDSLVWMRDRIPEDFLASTRYWVQDFVGVRERLAETASEAVVVGPIVRAMDPAPMDARAGVVVNLGGLESPYQGDAGGLRYADFVVEGLLRADVLRAFDGHALIMGGRRCIAHLRQRHAGTKLEFASLPHTEALARLRRSAIVLSTPGLTTALECFQLGIPTFFLPPQNYSQWWILTRLRERDLAPRSFHWADTLLDHPLTERMPEERRVPLLRDLLDRLTADAEAARRLHDTLDGVLAVDRTALAARQRSFFDMLGANGVTAIAGELAALC